MPVPLDSCADIGSGIHGDHHPGADLRCCFNRPCRTRLIPLMVLVFLISSYGCGKLPSTKPPQVAVVNGKAILLADYQKSLEAEVALLKGSGVLKPAEMDGLKEAVLNQLIREELMLQRARTIPVTVEEVELAARIEEIKKDYSGDQFIELFGSGKVDYAVWKEALRKRVLFEKLIARDVNEKIEVTDGEAERHYNENRKQYAVAGGLRVAQIVLPDSERAEAVLKRLKAGEDFDKVAREVSIGPEAQRGGDLGFFPKGIMPEAIDRMVFSLPMGKISRVVQSPYGYHIFKVLGHEREGGRNFSDVKQKVVADLRRQKEAGAYEAWLEGLKAKAVIQIQRPLPGLREVGSTSIPD